MSNVYLKHTIWAIFIASLFTYSAQAQSQSQSKPSDEAAADTLKLNSIVVTASKMPQSQRETTKPVQIIDRAEIEKNAGRDLSQILNQQSGIRVNDSFGAPSNGRILYLQGAAATNTLILIDGLAINDPSGTGGLFDLRLLSTENIERIEILKGSQSTLYGTDAIAGVINIITRVGGDDLVNGNATISYGSFDTFDRNVGLNGTLTDGVRYNLSYSRKSSDGFSAAENPENTGSFGNDGFLMDSFFGRFDLSGPSNLSISPTIRYSDYSGDYDGGAFTDADNEFNLSMFSPGVQVKYASDSFRINADYNYTHTDRAFRNSFGENEFEGRFHNSDIYANVSLSDYVKVLAGINYQDFSIPGGDEQADQDASISSPYTTVYLEDLNGFSTELGYRLNSHSEYGSNSTYSISPSYALSEQVKLYASYSTGFKAPTLDELFGPFGANPGLEPQKSRYINIGTEAYLLDQSLKLGAQLFSREIDDLIIYSANGFLNRDRQNDRGVEFSADLILNGSVSVGGWYNYLDGEITTQGDSGEVTEDNLIRRPTHSIGLRAGVEVLENLTVRVNGEYNGERTDLYFNPANGFAAEDVTLDPYLLVNLFTEYSFLDRRFSLFADFKNLLNSDFTEVYGYNTTGTSVQAGLKLNF